MGSTLSSGQPAPAPARPTPDGPFPPPGFKSPHERTARNGDGVWEAWSGVDPIGGSSAIYRSRVHPDRYRRDIYVELLAIDLQRVALHLSAGTHEPESLAVPQDERTGLIPEAEQPRLVAVFNGGFKARHGGFGMQVGSHVFVPAKPDACSVLLLEDGQVKIGMWSALQTQSSPLRAHRQTPPCLVETGKLNPALNHPWKRRKWGLAVGGKEDVRRSAIGVDPSGRTLFYGLGEWVHALHLAEAMAAAGAVSAAQLDINWSYTRFLSYAPSASEGTLEVRAALIPKLVYHKHRYVEKPAYRDFFYLLRRP